jgi:RimJ/RimL family protein N-acetyltransferase
MTNQDNSESTYEPLTLRRFGIELRRMVESDKEIVRMGRNKDFVRENHVHQELITEVEQEKWFIEMNQKNHYVFVVLHKNQKIGVVYLRGIPDDLSVSTCGLFFWDDDSISTRLPVFAAFLALDFASYYCGVKRIESIVLKSNNAGIKMYTFFGFELREKDENTYLISIENAAYAKRRDTLLAFISRAIKNKDEHQLRISGSQGILNHNIVNELLAKLATT